MRPSDGAQELAATAPLAAAPGRAAVAEGEDAALMARVKEGDERAFAALVDRYRDRLVAYLTRLSGSFERAEDLAQETFVRLYRAAPRYEERGQLAALLFRIATNLVRSEERKRRQARWIPFDASRHDAPRSSSPQSSVLRDEALAHLQRAVAELPLRYRVPLVLHEVEGWTVPRIADLLDCREGTVKSRISRGRSRLRERLEPYWNGGVA